MASYCPLSYMSGEVQECDGMCGYCPPADVHAASLAVASIASKVDPVAYRSPMDAYSGLCSIAEAVEALLSDGIEVRIDQGRQGQDG